MPRRPNHVNSADGSVKGGTGIPPEVYDIAFGWDAGPEIERLLFCCREAGVEPESALELGCGTGRLLRALRKRVPEAAGLDLNPDMVEYARSRITDQAASPDAVVLAEMSAFSLERTFDLVYASANTIRYVTGPNAVDGLWRCVAKHLRPGGVFVADLELGFAAEAEKLNQPASWTISRGQTLVHASWTVVSPPSPTTRCCQVEWVFDVKQGEPQGCWRGTFPLRTYDAEEFLRLATAEGFLSTHGLYMQRDPYVFEIPPEKTVGRVLAVLQRGINE